MARLATLAALVEGTLHGADREVTAVRGLEDAGPEHVTFLANPAYAARAAATRAGAILVGARHEALPAGCAQLVVRDPYLAMARIAQELHPSLRPAAGVHPTAVVEAGATIDPTAAIAALAYVGPGARVGPGCTLLPHSYVGREAELGAGCVLHPGARVLDRCQLGQRVILQAGAVIGADGFGYAPDAAGQRHKIPQLGIVVLGDDVEVGANTTIDRATFDATVIGAGTKIDNQVQLAHNVRTGPDCVICAQTGVAGSAALGARVVLAGQVGVLGHITLGDDVIAAARGAPAHDEPAGARVSGTPAIPHGQWLRQVAVLKELPELARRVQALERRLAERPA